MICLLMKQLLSFPTFTKVSTNLQHAKKHATIFAYNLCVQELYELFCESKEVYENYKSTAPQYLQINDIELYYRQVILSIIKLKSKISSHS